MADESKGAFGESNIPASAKDDSEDKSVTSEKEAINVEGETTGKLKIR